MLKKKKDPMLPMQGVQVQSLVGELISHVPRGVAKDFLNFFKNKQINKSKSPSQGEPRSPKDVEFSLQTLSKSFPEHGQPCCAQRAGAQKILGTKLTKSNKWHLSSNPKSLANLTSHTQSTSNSYRLSLPHVSRIQPLLITSGAAPQSSTTILSPLDGFHSLRAGLPASALQPVHSFSIQQPQP